MELGPTQEPKEKLNSFLDGDKFRKAFENMYKRTVDVEQGMILAFSRKDNDIKVIEVKDVSENNAKADYFELERKKMDPIVSIHTHTLSEDGMYAVPSPEDLSSDAYGAAELIRAMIVPGRRPAAWIWEVSDISMNRIWLRWENELPDGRVRMNEVDQLKTALIGGGLKLTVTELDSGNLAGSFADALKKHL